MLGVVVEVSIPFHTVSVSLAVMFLSKELRVKTRNIRIGRSCVNLREKINSFSKPTDIFITLGIPRVTGDMGKKKSVPSDRG